VYVAGWTSGAFPGQISSGSTDAFVRKYDTNGNEVWTRQFGTSGGDIANGISVNASGVYVIGSVSGTLPGQLSSGGRDAFVRKYDLNGNEVWTRQYPLVRVSGISVDASGIYVAGGVSGTLSGQISSGSTDAVVRKHDTNGNEVWTRQFGTEGYDGASGISVNASGVYVAGNTSGAFPGQISSGSTDAFVRKYDTNGNEVWTRQFGSESSDAVTGVSVDASGVYVTGEVISALPGQTYLGGEGDAFVRKYDTNGVEVWTRHIGTNSWDFAYGISVDASGVYVAGNTDGAFPGYTKGGGVPGDDLSWEEFDAFIVKMGKGEVNSTPTITNAIEDIELVVGGENFTIDLTTVFADADGDDLSFSFSGGNPSVATVSIVNNTLIVAAVADGTATITVTADDGKGGSVQDAFKVNVTSINVPPTVTNAIEDMELIVGEDFTIDLTTVFTDPDGDDLSFSFSNSNESAATVSISNNTLTVDALAEGTTTVTVTADDGNGGSVQDAFEVSVIAANVTPTVTSAIEDMELIVGEDFTIDLTTVFNDPDGDDLSFSVSNSNESAATASISNNTLTVDALAEGTITVTVTADDGKGGSVQDAFEVTITSINAVTSLERDGNEIPTSFVLFQNYPNPFKRWTTIPFAMPQVSEVTISVYNSLGKKVEELALGKLPAGHFETSLDTTGFSSGLYIYRFETNTYKDSKYMILQR